MVECVRTPNKRCMRMNVIFFLSVSNEQGERLERVVELFFPRRRIEKCRDLEELGKKLHEPYNYKDVVLLSRPARRSCRACWPCRICCRT